MSLNRRLRASAILAVLLAPAFLVSCVTEDMVDGRRWPGDHHDPDRHDSDYARSRCEDVINSDAYIECRREVDDARYRLPARKRDPGGLPSAPL